MTVEWSAVETAIEAFVSGALTASGYTGTTAVATVWRDKSSKAHKTTPYVELSIGSEIARGHDEITWEESGVAPSNVLVPTVSGVREFTLQIRVRSRSQSSDKAARNIAEVLRASLYHPYLRAVLDAAGVAFLLTSGSGSNVFAHEDRYESVCVLDVRFGVASELSLPAQSGAPVEGVEITPAYDETEYPLIAVP